MSSEDEDLESCLKQLPENVQELIRLRIKDGKTYEELEALTGVKAGTLQARVQRAALQLRKCMEQKKAAGGDG